MSDGPLVLFCSDPLAPARVDGHFAGQAAVARDLGGQVALIDHDALLSGAADAAVRRVPADSGPWWYRGWMIPAKSYVELAKALQRKGIELRVTPRRYRAAHELPGWYNTFQPVTAASVWMAWQPGVAPTRQDVMALASTLGPGPAVVKDFVKSRKHEWTTACFVPEAADLPAATAVVAEMVSLQGEDLNGGIVMRRFEEYREAETRVWWVDGRPVMVTAHPDTPGPAGDADLTPIAPLVTALGCAFVTTDVTQRADGVWRVVEVGDGQVSDMPTGADPAPLFARLAAASTIDKPAACPACRRDGTPILFGLPTPQARVAAEDGALVLRGCLRSDDAPHWICAGGHEWSTTETQWCAAVDAIVFDYESR